MPWYAVVLPEILTIPGAGWLAVGGTTSYFLFSLGWLLFAAASFRAHVFPRLVCICLMLGAVAGFFAALPPYGAVLGVAVLWLGITVLRERPLAPTSAPRVDRTHTRAARGLVRRGENHHAR